MSGSSYPTLSVQLPYFVVIASRLEKLVDDLSKKEPSCLLQALNQAWVKLNEYHAKTASSQAISTILDPRYKLQTFRHLDWKDEWIMDAHKSFVDTYELQYAPKPVEDSSLVPLISDTETSTGKPKHEDDFLNAVYGSQTIPLPPLNLRSEVEIYLEEPIEGRNVCDTSSR